MIAYCICAFFVLVFTGWFATILGHFIDMYCADDECPHGLDSDDCPDCRH